MMTSVALMTATAGRPFLSFSRLADEVLISETIRCPPPMSSTTSLMTAPPLTATTVPGNWLRALSGIVPTVYPRRSALDEPAGDGDHREARFTNTGTIDMASNWYYAKAGQQHGPISAQALV